MFPPPVAIGLIVCEKVIVEEGTKNLTLVSTFTKLTVSSSTTPPRFVVYAVLTDGLGEATIQLSVVEMESAEEIYSRQMVTAFADPLAEVRILFRIQPCSFPATGNYQIMLPVDGELVAQRQLAVTVGETPS